MGESMAVVGCGALKKEAGIWPAKELYTSTYFKKKRRYAETCCTGWVILSAEYGVVEPDERLKPYDTTISDLSDEELREWAAAAYEEILKRVEGMDAAKRKENRVIWLAGEDYVKPIEDVAMQEGTRNLPCRSSLPFRNTSGIGEQMKWLNEQVQDETAEQSGLDRWS